VLMSVTPVSLLATPLFISSLVACVSVLALSPSKAAGFFVEVLGSALTVVFVVGSGSLVGLFRISALFGEYEGAMIMCSAIVLIDRFAGGPKCNPCVSLILWLWGVSKPLDVAVEVAGQMAGGIIGFPLLASICQHFGDRNMGGPGVDLAKTELQTALTSEALASCLLTTTIALLGMTRVGQVYWIKQPAIAACIRLIATRPFFGATGPAMNPMLPTSYAIFANGAWPLEPTHFAIYWGAALGGAAMAALALAAILGIGQASAAPAASDNKMAQKKKQKKQK